MADVALNSYIPKRDVQPNRIEEHIMLHMNYLMGTLDKAKAIKIIKASDKPCLYTDGIGGFPNDMQTDIVTKQQGIELINRHPCMDIIENEKFFCINRLPNQCKLY